MEFIKTKLLEIDEANTSLGELGGDYAYGLELVNDPNAVEEDMLKIAKEGYFDM